MKTVEELRAEYKKLEQYVKRERYKKIKMKLKMQ